MEPPNHTTVPESPWSTVLVGFKLRLARLVLTICVDEVPAPRRPSDRRAEGYNHKL